MSKTPDWIANRARAFSDTLMQVVNAPADDDAKRGTISTLVEGLIRAVLTTVPYPANAVEGEPSWVCIEGMNAEEFAAYEYGCIECLLAVKRVLDGKDTGQGAVQEEWRGVRQQLLDLVQKVKSISEGDIKASPEGSYAVSSDVYWRYDPAPRGVKVYLLTKGGVAIAPGQWRDGMGLIAWHPVFKRDKAKEVELGLTDD